LVPRTGRDSRWCSCRRQDRSSTVSPLRLLFLEVLASRRKAERLQTTVRVALTGSMARRAFCAAGAPAAA
jgi:hypothetical protein